MSYGLGLFREIASLAISPEAHAMLSKLKDPSEKTLAILLLTPAFLLLALIVVSLIVAYATAPGPNSARVTRLR